MGKIPPVQAFYCCYLLRSTVRHASLYVGSTPHPVRRLRQHNGDAKGGAVRTSKGTLRPWEMTCLVTGFPSTVAALQFEWAWQNSHLTRHIAPGSRITQVQAKDRFSPKSGKVRKRNTRPRMCLSDRLLNLHALLASASFARWPLRVTFFAEDVFRVWQKATVSRPDCGATVTMDGSSRAENAATEGVKGIHAIDVGYSGQKQHLEKSQKLFECDSTQSCSICKNTLPRDGSFILVCPTDNCKAVTHLECLATRFRSQKESEGFLPSEGHCPSCGTKHRWVELVKEMTLRLRGDHEMKKIFKVKKPRTKQAKAGQPTAVEDYSEAESDEQLDEAPALDDNWHSISDEEHDISELPPVRNDPSPIPRKAFTFPTYWEPVIEDSDLDEADIIT